MALADQIAAVRFSQSIVRGRLNEVTSCAPYDGFVVERLEKTLVALEVVVSTLQYLLDEGVFK